ncbi:MAG: hypothetical protein H6740_29450, partial [Alphaproteobacteria bacterium]|nr:hypothetical protein [Alphaproteobacteria bacterium]
PFVLERARKLIRYAAAAVASPKCAGTDQVEAQAHLSRAMGLYEDARAKVLDGQMQAAMATLRRSVEQVALTAAKAGRSCGRGQTSLTALMDEPSTTSTQSGSRKTKVPKRARPSSRPTAPQAPARTRPSARPKPTPVAERAPVIDAEKDALLMAAFTDAIKAALQGEDAGHRDLPAAAAMRSRGPSKALAQVAAQAREMLRVSEEESYLDTGDALELLTQAQPHLPEDMQGRVDAMLRESEEEGYIDSGDLVEWLERIADLGGA